MNELLGFAIVFIGGIIFMYIAWVKLNRASTKGEDMVEHEGIVFDIVKESRGSSVDGPRTYVPVIRFVTKEDKSWITEKLTDGFAPGVFEKGETVKLRYNRKNPKDFYIVSAKINLQYFFIMLVGAAVSLLGLYKILVITEVLG